MPSSLRLFLRQRQATNPLQIVIPTEASHPRRGWEAEWRDLRAPGLRVFETWVSPRGPAPSRKKLRTDGWPSLSRPLRRLGLLARAAKPSNRIDSNLFPPPCRPLRFDLHHPILARYIMPEAAPGPILRRRHQPPCHRITMHISQLLHALALAPHIEIVVSCLPERSSFTGAQSAKPSASPSVATRQAYGAPVRSSANARGRA